MKRVLSKLGRLDECDEVGKREVDEKEARSIIYIHFSTTHIDSSLTAKAVKLLKFVIQG